MNHPMGPLPRFGYFCSGVGNEVLCRLRHGFELGDAAGTLP